MTLSFDHGGTSTDKILHSPRCNRLHTDVLRLPTLAQNQAWHQLPPLMYSGSCLTYLNDTIFSFI